MVLLCVLCDSVVSFLPPISDGRSRWPERGAAKSRRYFDIPGAATFRPANLPNAQTHSHSESDSLADRALTAKDADSSSASMDQTPTSSGRTVSRRSCTGIVCRVRSGCTTATGSRGVAKFSATCSPRRKFVRCSPGFSEARHWSRFQIRMVHPGAAGRVDRSGRRRRRNSCRKAVGERGCVSTRETTAPRRSAEARCRPG